MILMIPFTSHNTFSSFRICVYTDSFTRLLVSPQTYRNFSLQSVKNLGGSITAPLCLVSQLESFFCPRVRRILEYGRIRLDWRVHRQTFFRFVAIRDLCLPGRRFCKPSFRVRSLSRPNRFPPAPHIISTFFFF